jgi:hypothetical protein
LHRRSAAASLVAVVTEHSGAVRQGGRVRKAIILGTAGFALLAIAAGRGDAGATAAPGSQLTSVLVTTRDLPASAVLAPADVMVQSVAASNVDRSLARSVSEVVGRRLLLPVPAQTPIERVMVGAATDTASDLSHRIVRLDLIAAHVAPDVTAPGETEVVASTDGASPTGTSSRRVGVVAVCRLLQLDATAATVAAGGSTDALNAPASATIPELEAVLDCDAAAALRVLFAADFAHALRLLAHPPGGGPVVAAVDGGA